MGAPLPASLPASAAAAAALGASKAPPSAALEGPKALLRALAGLPAECPAAAGEREEEAVEEGEIRRMPMALSFAAAAAAPRAADKSR